MDTQRPFLISTVREQACRQLAAVALVAQILVKYRGLASAMRGTAQGLILRVPSWISVFSGRTSNSTLVHLGLSRCAEDKTKSGCPLVAPGFALPKSTPPAPILVDVRALDHRHKA